MKWFSSSSWPLVFLGVAACGGPEPAPHAAVQVEADQSESGLVYYECNESTLLQYNYGSVDFFVLAPPMDAPTFVLTSPTRLDEIRTHHWAKPGMYTPTGNIVIQARSTGAFIAPCSTTSVKYYYSWNGWDFYDFICLSGEILPPDTYTILDSGTQSWVSRAYSDPATGATRTVGLSYVYGSACTANICLPTETIVNTYGSVDKMRAVPPNAPIAFDLTEPAKITTIRTLHYGQPIAASDICIFDDEQHEMGCCKQTTIVLKEMWDGDQTYDVVCTIGRFLSVGRYYVVDSRPSDWVSRTTSQGYVGFTKVMARYCSGA